MTTFVKAIKFLKIIHVIKGEYLFQQGDIGDKAYVILAGKVLFLIRKTHYWTSYDIPEKIILAAQEAEIVKNEHGERCEDIYQKSITCEKVLVGFNPGKLFGEIALIEEDEKH